jgi:hypothetical protein
LQTLQGHDPYGTYVRRAEALVAVREAPLVLRVEIWLSKRGGHRGGGDGASSVGTRTTVTFADSIVTGPTRPPSPEPALASITIPVPPLVHSNLNAAKGPEVDTSAPDSAEAPSQSTTCPTGAESLPLALQQSAIPTPSASLTTSAPSSLTVNVGLNVCASTPSNPPTVSNS